jgi:Gpi18-like mannosyltransferase
MLHASDIPTQKNPVPISVYPKLFTSWKLTVKRILPVYIASHIVYFLLTYVSVLFLLPNFSPKGLPLSTLLHAWNRWDTGQFTTIANHGYQSAWQTAFFPLYPILEYLLAFVTRSSFVAGLIIANIATFVLLVILSRLIEMDFQEELASRAILYLVVFPSAFFLSAAYNESIFLLLVVASFYCLRTGQWWLAGLAGFFATLTRSAGILLLVPFCWEYVRQHQFQLKKFRLDVVSVALLPAGLILFALYCARKFNDFLAFSHAQAVWGRHLALPITMFYYALRLIHHGPGVLNFTSIHLVIDLITTVCMLVLTVLCFIGPWKFTRDQWSYAFYALILYLFLIMFPAPNFPLQSNSRLMLEMWPAFIILARIGKRPDVNLYYLMISWSLLCFLLLQFLTGFWTV